MLRAPDRLAWLVLLLMPIERFATVTVGEAVVRPVYGAMLLFVLFALPVVRVRRGLLCGALVVVLAAGVAGAGRVTLAAWAANMMWAVFTAVFACIFASYLSQPERFEWAARAWLATATFWAGVVIVQWVLAFVVPSLAYSWLGPIPRVHGPMYEPSYLPLYLLPPLGVALARRLWAPSSVLALAVLLSSSRTGLLGLAVLLAASYLLGGRAVRRAVAIFVVGAVFVAGPVMLFLPVGRGFAQALEGFVIGAVSLQDVSSTLPRLDSWRAAWNVFTHSPVFGAGLGGFGAAAERLGWYGQAGVGTYKTTNLYLEVLAEMGVFGGVVFASWCVGIFALAWRAPRGPSRAGFVAGWLTLLVLFALVQTWWRPYVWVFASLAAAHALALPATSSRRISRD